jgi:hypothetical protein
MRDYKIHPDAQVYAVLILAIIGLIGAIILCALIGAIL